MGQGTRGLRRDGRRWRRLEELGSDRPKRSRQDDHEDWKVEGVGGRLLDRAGTAARDCGSAVLRHTTPVERPNLPAFFQCRGYSLGVSYPIEYRDYDEILGEK